MSSLKLVRKLSARGITTKYENATPTAKSTVEKVAKTATVRCMLVSIAGARNAQSW